MAIDEIRESIAKLASKGNVFARGQVISVLIAGTGIFATFLSNTKPRSTNFPTLLSFFNYLLLSTYLIRPLVFSRSVIKSQNNHQSRKPWYWYLFATILDMEANYMVIQAYNYTTITSVMLLDCFTIPAAMILSWLFLSYKYTYQHMAGALICVFGLVVIVVTDVTTNSPTSPPNALLGDILCLFGSTLYAAGNVLQEHLVKSHSREDYLGLLGGFGCGIAFIQCLIVDLPGIKRTRFTSESFLYMFGFVSCLFLMYTNTSMFLVESDATLFNLSLLTSDVYAVIFSYFLNGQLVQWEYFIAFGLVLIGLYIYHSEVPPSGINIQDTEDDRTESSANIVLGKNEYTLVGDTSPMSNASNHSIA